MSNIEQAAAAFDQDMGNSSSAGSEVASKDVARVSVEDIFRPRQIEVDDDSPAVGGGDDMPLPKPKRVAREPAQAAIEGEDEFDEDAILYAPEPGEEGEDGEDGEDGDGEDGEDGEDAEGEVGELPEQFLAAKVKILVDGEEQEVTVDEALKGYTRTDTFHRRLNQVSEAAKEVQAVAQKVVEERRKAIEMIDTLGTQLAGIIPEEPDWDALFKEDAPKARQLQKNYGELTGKLRALADQRAELIAKNQADEEAQLKTFIAEEQQKVFEENTHWSDPKKRAKDLSSMVRTLRAHRFSDKEIASLYDSRMIGIVLKASKFDRMMAARPKPAQRGKNPVVPSGAGRVRTAPKVARAQQQLSRTGRVDDAAAVFAQLIR